MKIRPYITYNGECKEAVELYKEAFKTEIIDLLLFSDMPEDVNHSLPEEYKNRVLQCMMRFGEDFIRLSDCGPNTDFNEQESKRLSLVFESDEKSIQHAYVILSQKGKVEMSLAKTFYSPLSGIVIDKFGVMWNLVTVDNDSIKHVASKATKTQHRWSKEVSKVEFYVDSRESKATIIWQKRNEMLLKKGAIMMKDAPLNKDGSLGFAAKMGTALRSEHQDKVNNFITTEDIIFKSVNEIGLFLYFGGTNSWLEIKDENGKTIEEWTKV